MRFAVTGSSGNFGQYIVNYLRKTGHQVIELGRKKPETSDQWGYYNLGEPLNFESIGPVDVFIHAAYDFSAKTKEDVYSKNVKPSIDILTQAIEKKVKVIIFISTVSAFEGCQSMYGAGKYEVEKAVSRLGGINIRSALMFSNNPGGMVGKLSAVASRLPIIPLVGASKNMYVSHLESLSEAILQISKNPFSYFGQTLTLAYPKPYLFKELISILAKRSGNRVLIIPIYWRLVWLLLVTMEKLGIDVGFRSDSLTGLMETSILKVTEIKELSVVFKRFEDF